jgi:hypothetical protein
MRLTAHIEIRRKNVRVLDSRSAQRPEAPRKKDSNEWNKPITRHVMFRGSEIGLIRGAQAIWPF